MNLMLNGIEAMKDTGGELTITLKDGRGWPISDFGERFGVGLPLEEPERIFETFFHHESRGQRNGAVHQSQDNRIARRPLVGDRQPGTRRHVSLHFATSGPTFSPSLH